MRMTMLVVAALVAAGCDRVIDRLIERNFARVDRAVLQSPDLTVVLCGTGSPIADARRAGACTAIVAGGEVLLVDVGPGSWEALDLADAPTDAVSTVLLTHFHSDHIGDLGEAATQGWIAGRTRPLDVYGPPGTARIAAAFQEAYAQDADARTLHHGEAYLPREAAKLVGHDVAIPGADAVVFARNGLTVTAFPVDHDPVRPAIGYRFDYRGRSVLVSGDTRKSASLLAHARGVDILVHEALNRDVIGRAIAVARATGRERIAKLATDASEYHTTPVEVAEIARDAGVGTIVLTHLVPAPPNWLLERRFKQGMSDVFPGEIVLGRDGMRFTLPPKS